MFDLQPPRHISTLRVSPVAPRPREGPLTEPTAGAQPWPRERVLLPLCRPSHPRLDELGDFGDLVADFAALAAAGLWQVHVGSLPRTCSGLRLQKRAVLLAAGDRGGGLFNDTHRRHHGPRPKAHPPNTDAREIRDFGNTLRHHDVDRQRRE
jgi:hypothetical protein